MHYINIDCQCVSSTLVALLARYGILLTEIATKDKISLANNGEEIPLDLFNDLENNFINVLNNKYPQEGKAITFNDIISNEKNNEDVYAIENISMKLKYFIVRSLLTKETQRILIEIPNSAENLVINAIGSCHCFVSKATEDSHQVENHKPLQLHHMALLNKKNKSLISVKNMVYFMLYFKFLSKNRIF